MVGPGKYSHLLITLWLTKVYVAISSQIKPFTLEGSSLGHGIFQVVCVCVCMIIHSTLQRNFLNAESKQLKHTRKSLKLTTH